MGLECFPNYKLSLKHYLKSGHTSGSILFAQGSYVMKIGYILMYILSCCHAFCDSVLLLCLSLTCISHKPVQVITTSGGPNGWFGNDGCIWFKVDSGET